MGNIVNPFKKPSSSSIGAPPPPYSLEPPAAVNSSNFLHFCSNFREIHPQLPSNGVVAFLLAQKLFHHLSTPELLALPLPTVFYRQ